MFLRLTNTPSFMIITFSTRLEPSCTAWTFMTSLCLHWWNFESFFRSTDIVSTRTITGHTSGGWMDRVCYILSINLVHLWRRCYFVVSVVHLHAACYIWCWCWCLYHSTILHNVAVRPCSWKSRISGIRVNVLVPICNPWGGLNIRIAILSVATWTTISFWLWILMRLYFKILRTGRSFSIN